MTTLGPAGVRMLGIGSAAPDRVVTNTELATFVDTSDEWITQRTGIERRHFCDPEKGETPLWLASRAIQNALDDAGLEPGALDLLILASVTQEMICPSNACRIAARIGAAPAAAFDLIAACSGFVYGMNVADSLIRCGRFRTVGVIGCEVLSSVIDFEDRGVAILFGDGAGAAVLTRDEARPDAGCIYQNMGADGTGWESLYLPRRPEHVPPGDEDYPAKLDNLRMHGREVYKFAVRKFGEVIEDALEKTGLTVDDVAQFVCHQSNLRIIESAIERCGLPPEKVHVNIDEYGNTSAASLGLVLDDLHKAGKIGEGDIVVMVAFGAGLTWGSSVWRL